MDPITATAVIAAAAAGTGAWHTQRRAHRAERQLATLRGQLAAERHAASHDPLTDLLNRRAFYRQALAVTADPKHHPLVAIVIDLDYFKQVNDHYGHTVGDHVLTTIAHRLAAYPTQPGHNLTARLGGDEFADLRTLPSTDIRHLHHLVTELHQLLATPINFGRHTLTVTASIGLAPVRGPDMGHLAEALHLADHHMYRTKTAHHGGMHRIGAQHASTHRSAAPVAKTEATAMPAPTRHPS
jgi:diguanylate cyclase (GGDEF)-like protein